MARSAAFAWFLVLAAGCGASQENPGTGHDDDTVTDDAPDQIPAYAAPTAVERTKRYWNFLSTERALLLNAGFTEHPAAPSSDTIYGKEAYLRAENVTAYSVDRINDYMSVLAATTDSAVPYDAIPQMHAPDGYVTPEELDPRVGDGVSDATDAIAGALGRGHVWLTPGKVYVITTPVTVPAGHTMLSNGFGTLLCKTGEGAFNSVTLSSATAIPADACLRVVNAADVTLRDFQIATSFDEPAPQRFLSAVQGRLADNLTVSGVAFRGFPRAAGIVVCNSCTNLLIENSMFYGSRTRDTTRQVTAIVIDESRSQDGEGTPLNSMQPVLRDNLIFGLALDQSVIEDTQYRNGLYLGYEADGINIQSAGITTNPTITGNTVFDVGECTDTFNKGGEIAFNHFERCCQFAVKRIHGAGDMFIHHNTIIAPGFDGVVLQGGDIAETKNERVIANTILFPGAFDQRAPFALYPAGGIHLESATTDSVSLAYVFANSIRYPQHLDNPNTFGALACSYPTAQPDPSYFGHNIVDLAYGAKSNVKSHGCEAPNQLAADTITTDWTATAVTTSSAALAYLGAPVVTTHIADTSALALHDLTQQLPLSSPNKVHTLTTLVHHANFGGLMLRDQNLDAHAIFKFGNAAPTVTTSGAATASAMALGDDWYLLAVQLKTSGAHPNALLTFRSLDATGNGSFAGNPANGYDIQSVMVFEGSVLAP